IVKNLSVKQLPKRESIYRCRLGLTYKHGQIESRRWQSPCLSHHHTRAFASGGADGLAENRDRIGLRRSSASKRVVGPCGGVARCVPADGVLPDSRGASDDDSHEERFPTRASRLARGPAVEHAPAIDGAPGNVTRITCVARGFSPAFAGLTSL